MPNQGIQHKKLPRAWMQVTYPYGRESSWTTFDPTKHQPTIEELNPFNNPYQYVPNFKAPLDDQMNLQFNPQKVEMSDSQVDEYTAVYEAQKVAYEAGLHFTAFDPFKDPEPEPEPEPDADAFQDQEQPPLALVEYEYQNQMNVYLYNPGQLPEGEWIPQEWTEPGPEPVKPAWIPYEDQVHQFSGHPQMIFTEYGQFVDYKGTWLTLPYDGEGWERLFVIQRKFAKEGRERLRKEQKAYRKAAKADAKAEAKINKEAEKVRAKALKEGAKALQPPKECWLRSLKPWWATEPKRVAPSRTWQYAQVGP